MSKRRGDDVNPSLGEVVDGNEGREEEGRRGGNGHAADVGEQRRAIVGADISGIAQYIRL
jgi:hypothetical protein